MGVVIPLEPKRNQRRRMVNARDELPLVLARLLAAGATEFTRVALDAWGSRDMEPDELLELCATYAAVVGLETSSCNGMPAM
jgi:hypothetical protein